MIVNFSMHQGSGWDAKGSLPWLALCTVLQLENALVSKVVQYIPLPYCVPQSLGGRYNIG